MKSSTERVSAFCVLSVISRPVTRWSVRSQILPNREFPWVQQLESEWRDIRAELDSVLTRPEDIPVFHQISPDQRRISRGDHWKTFALYIFRQPIEENCAQCPVTTRLLAGLPRLQNAWFSILAPRY